MALSKTLLPLITLLSLAVATPVIHEARQPAPVTVAPAPSVSITPSTMEYTVYFASEQCEFTSSTETMKAGDCISVGGFESFSFNFFQNGNDHPAGTTCQLEVFDAPGCAAPAATSVPASGVNVSNTCSSATGGSALLSC